jgi:hypothetical protein
LHIEYDRPRCLYRHATAEPCRETMRAKARNFDG